MYRILSISRLQDAPAELGPPVAIEETDYPPDTPRVLGSVMEAVTCCYFSDIDSNERFYNVMFKYKKYGLARRTTEYVRPDSEGGVKKIVVGWYENPNQGRWLNVPIPREIFPGKNVGDLFLNWLEYPVRCQMWQFNATSWSPFKMGGWVRVEWGFQRDDYHLVILQGEKAWSPAFVPKQVYDEVHKNRVPIIVG